MDRKELRRRMRENDWEFIRKIIEKEYGFSNLRFGLRHISNKQTKAKLKEEFGRQLLFFPEHYSRVLVVDVRDDELYVTVCPFQTIFDASEYRHKLGWAQFSKYCVEAFGEEYIEYYKQREEHETEKILNNVKYEREKFISAEIKRLTKYVS